MFKVCFYSDFAQKEVVTTKHKTLEKASQVARQWTIDTGKTHYIITKDGNKLNRYKQPIDIKWGSELE